MSLGRLLEFGPVVALLVLWVLLAVLFGSLVLCNQVLKSVVLLDALLRLFYLSLELLDFAFVVVLLLDLGPELAARLAQRQLKGLA